MYVLLDTSYDLKDAKDNRVYHLEYFRMKKSNNDGIRRRKNIHHLSIFFWVTNKQTKFANQKKKIEISSSPLLIMIIINYINFQRKKSNDHQQQQQQGIKWMNIELNWILLPPFTYHKRQLSINDQSKETWTLNFSSHSQRETRGEQRTKKIQQVCQKKKKFIAINISKIVMIMALLFLLLLLSLLMTPRHYLFFPKKKEKNWWKTICLHIVLQFTHWVHWMCY